MFGVRLSKMGSASKLGLIAKAIGILRKYGADAHVYLPGIGTVSGLTAGNYLDSAGTTQASVDNPVGLSLDALQAMTLGSELAPALSAGNGWTVDAGWSLGTNQTTAASAGAGTATYKAIGSTNGNTYRITFTLSGYVSGSCYATLFNGVNGPAISANGTYTCTLTRNFVTDLAGVAAATANFTGTISGLSIKQIPGIHATQGTTANKPILRRGLLNQLLYSYNLANAAWNQGGVGPVTMNGNRATIQTTSTAVRYLTQTVPGYAAASGEKITQAIAIKKTTGTLTRYPVFASEQSIGSKMLGITTIDTTNGIVTSWSAYTGFTILPGSVVTIADYGDLWLVALSGATDTSATVWAEFYPAAASTATQSTGQVTGAIGPDVVVAGLGLFKGHLTAQQIIDAGGIPLTTTAAASNPNAGKYWWQLDSTDLLTATYPAGYESATIINALTSGVTTTQGVNVVGSYSIGPSVNTAGRIVLKTAPTAEKLAVLQSFMGLLI